MNVTSLIAEIRYHINDIEGLGYPDELLKEFISDGLCMVYKLAPHDFTKRQLFKAQTGSVQCLNSCCDSIVSVDAQTDACGNVIKGVKNGRISAVRSFNKKSVKPKHKQYTVELRDNIKDSFDVAPPVKADEDIYFLITCTQKPSIDDELPNCAYHQALLHYVLYRAYSIETESQTSMSNAQREYAYFYQLVTGLSAMEKEIKEDTKSD